MAFQNNSVVNYPNNYDFTRIIEHKYFLGANSEKTVISYEYPEDYSAGKGERYYPIDREENILLYSSYLKRAQEKQNTFFLGRLGDYKYYDMDKAVARALDLFSKLV